MQGPQGEGDADAGGGDGEKPTTYDWLNLVSCVAAETRFNFAQVYELPVREFLSYLLFINEKKSREEAEIRKLKQQTRII